MPVGHVRMGATVETMREYMLTSAEARNRSLANPFAAKIGSGAGKYDDLENASAWVMDDWQSGAGTVAADGGGYLFGTLDSRVPHQLILPPALGATSWNAKAQTHVQMFDDASGKTVVTKAVAANEVISWTLTVPTPPGGTPVVAFHWVHLFVKLAKSQVLTLTVYDAAGTTLLATATATQGTDKPSHDWISFTSFTPSWTPVVGTTYILKIVSVAAFELLTVDNIPFFLSHAVRVALEKVVRFGNYLYGMQSIYLWRYDTVGQKWEFRLSLGGFTVKDMWVWNGKLYLGKGSLANAQSMDSAETLTTEAWQAETFTQWNGYFWRSIGKDVYYTADGTTWTGPIAIGSSDYPVAAMQGMGTDMYCATKEALFRIGAADVVYGVVRWGTVAAFVGGGLSSMPTAMVNYGGDLYVAVDGRVVRYTAAGQVTDVWFKDNGDLPAGFAGLISTLTVMNNWLLAGVTDTQGRNSVWAWNKNGWHPVAILPVDTLYHCYYDRSLSRLWMATDGIVYYVPISDYVQNPYTDANSRYVPVGWMETGWFDGNLIELLKFVFGVYCTGDNLSANQNVQIYYRSDAVSAWTLLGTITGDRQEIRWENPDYLASRRLRLALVLRSNSVNKTPKLEAVRTKYYNVVNDRWRWQLQIAAHDKQQMLDGTINPYGGAEIRAGLDGLITSPTPVLFKDFDGTMYEVMVVGASENAVDVEFYDEELHFKSVYSLTIEQITSGAFVAS